MITFNQLFSKYRISIFVNSTRGCARLADETILGEKPTANKGKISINMITVISP